MAEPAPATENNEARRIEMLRAAAELICERGFGDTRIADVAKRAGVSSALVIYYFGTRDRLLVDALRFSEESFYEAAEKMLAEVTSLRERLSLLIKWTCVPEADNEIPGAWGLWFDLWAQAFRHDEVRAGRVELDARWRRMIVDAIKSAEASDELDVEVDARLFALEFSALLDGLSIQVALDDPEVDSDLAYKLAMRFAERELNLPPVKTPARPRSRLERRRAELFGLVSATGSEIGLALLRCSTLTASWVQTHVTAAPGRWVTDAGPDMLGTSTINLDGAPTSTCTWVERPEIHHLRHRAADRVVPLAHW